MNKQSYIVCTTPRSGSTLLCGLMAATGVCGTPNSYFHNATREGWLADLGLKAADYATSSQAVAAGVSAVIRAGRGKTETFGLRLQGSYLPFMLKQMADLLPNLATDSARIEAAFGRPHFIHLTRNDRLAQSISREIATQSGLWHRAADGSEMERLSPSLTPCYDREALLQHMEQAEALDAQWQAWFTAQNIIPLRINYSDLADDPIATLARILRETGQDAGLVKGVAPQVQRLSDARNLDWAARFLAGE